MIDLNEIYRPEWELAYSILIDTTSVISICLYPFVMYAIIFKSPSTMKAYKWMLANCITWSFLLELLISTFKPYVMLPLSMGKMESRVGMCLGFSVGIVKYLGHYGSYLFFELMCSSYAMASWSLGLCTLYRYSLALPVDGGHLFAKTWHLVVCMIVAFFTLICPPIVAIVLSRVPAELLEKTFKECVSFRLINAYIS